jgi:competence protein ComEA
MDAAPLPPLGVAATPAAPPPPPPAWSGAAPAPRVPVAVPSVALPAAEPAWPRSAQWAIAVLLVAALGLLAWHGIAASRWAARPTTLEPGAGIAFQLDLNRADHAQLVQLPGVGDGLAARVEAYRAERHGFRSVDELRHVGGIGPTTLERLRPFVYVGGLPEGEEREETTPDPPRAAPRDVKPRGGMAVTGKKAAGLTSPVDINRASPEELQRLPGVGPALSARIVEARRQRPFASVDELRLVPGIGPKTLERLRPHVVADAR